jgi:hypothetical protein
MKVQLMDAYKAATADVKKKAESLDISLSSR